MEINRKPLGVLIFGGLNCFFFGLFFFLLSITGFFTTTPKDLAKITEIFRQQGLTMTLSYHQYKMVCLLYVLLALIFFISGAGLIANRSWARKLTIYFAFSLLLLIFIAAVGAPFLIGEAFVQSLYPVMLILYFTGKNTTQFFKR